MRINDISLPYPVLSTGDDVAPSLTEDCIQVDCDHGNDAITFNIRLQQDNAEITRLIQDGYAEYTCEVTCPRTYIRRCYRSKDPVFHIELKRKDIFGRIEFSCFVTVKQTITEYRNPEFNADYDNAAFLMEPGDILAAFPVASYNADLKYEKLYSAGSFMVVQEDKNAKQVWFDANQDQVIVYLPAEMFALFKELHGDRNFNELFHASIVFNCLVKILSEYNKSKEYLQWAEAIRYRIDHEDDLHEFDIEDTGRAYELAQALLRDPYRRMFNHLKNLKED